MRNQIVFLFFAVLSSFSLSGQVKILFDASQAQMAGNADWVIDANTYNIGFNASGNAVSGGGNEANAQAVPSPAQSGITASTAETYWSGALSYWAIDLVKMGYQVSTLPYNGVISFGNASNTQDLSNYKVFIVCEPNIRFTATERTALINFVANGGGLFMIADHTISDRNNDGWDSPEIWNDLMTNNSVQLNPFGISFDLEDISVISYNVKSGANDSIINGAAGPANGLKFSSGTTMKIDSLANPTVKGIIYSGGIDMDQDSIMFASANYGNGRVAALGDSSPPDDGTGDSNDNLYFGYTDMLGYHRKLLLNATVWLAGNTGSTSIAKHEHSDFSLFPNPAGSKLTILFPEDRDGHFEVHDMNGIRKMTGKLNNDFTELDVTHLEAGIYIITISSANIVLHQRFIIQK